MLSRLAKIELNKGNVNIPSSEKSQFKNRHIYERYDFQFLFLQKFLLESSCEMPQIFTQ